jgi:hypothetical protein
LVFTVVAEDQFNNTATGFTGDVTFSSTDTGTNTTLPVASPLSSGSGVFSATLTTAGDQTLTATQGTITGTSGSITVTVQSSDLHFVVTAPSTTEAGANLTFTVVAEDQFNNIATGFTGDVSFSSTDTGINTILPTVSPLTNGAGTFSATLTTAGDQTLTATQGTITGTGNTITVSASTAPVHFVVTAPPATTAGSNLTFTVVTEDQFNNTATGFTGDVTFSSSDVGSSTTLPAASPLNAGAGTFSATLTTAGDQTLTATQGTVSGTSDPITVSPATASHFVVITPPTATAGANFLFTVIAEDSFNNTDTGYAGAVAFGTSDPSKTLPGNATLNQGLGTFSATLNTVGNQTLTATDVNNQAITGTSAPINIITVALQDHFVISAPSSATAGEAFTFTVTAETQANTVDTGYSGTVHFSSSDPQVSPGNGLPTDATLTTGQGIFTATLKTSGSQTLTVADTASSTITAASATIVVNPSSIVSATHYSIRTPLNAEAGVPFRFTVLALDQFNHLATTYTGTVHFTSTDNTAILPADTTLTGGIGTFTATLSKAPGLGNGPTLRATDTIDSSITGTSRIIKVKGDGPANHKGGSKGGGDSQKGGSNGADDSQKGGSKGASDSQAIMAAVVATDPAASPSEASVQPVPQQPPGNPAHANGIANSDLADQGTGTSLGSPVVISDSQEQEPPDAQKGILHGADAVIPTVTKKASR